MQLGNYAVQIINGQEMSGGYVNLSHGQPYKIRLINSINLRCNAEIKIDGKPVGTWRIGAFDQIVLERPANDTGLFTFYRLGTNAAALAQIADNELTGLVQVTFTPEKAVSRTAQVQYTYDNDGLSVSKGVTRSAGGTGLSGHSNQQFGTAAYMDLDESAAVTINLRLVEMEPVNQGPRPLTPLSTPIPPRI